MPPKSQSLSRAEAKRIVTLDPPLADDELVRIYFCGQPALTTGVVNLCLLLGSYNYVLIEKRRVKDSDAAASADATQHRDRKQPSKRQENAQAANEEDDEEGVAVAEDEELDATAASSPTNSELDPTKARKSTYRKCSSEGLPAGCFHVKRDRHYWVMQTSVTAPAVAAAAVPSRAPQKRRRHRSDERPEKGKVAEEAAQVHQIAVPRPEDVASANSQAEVAARPQLTRRRKKAEQAVEKEAEEPAKRRSSLRHSPQHAGDSDDSLLINAFNSTRNAETVAPVEEESAVKTTPLPTVASHIFGDVDVVGDVEATLGDLFSAKQLASSSRRGKASVHVAAEHTDAQTAVAPSVQEDTAASSNAETPKHAPPQLPVPAPATASEATPREATPTKAPSADANVSLPRNEEEAEADTQLPRKGKRARKGQHVDAPTTDAPAASPAITPSTASPVDPFLSHTQHEEDKAEREAETTLSRRGKRAKKDDKHASAPAAAKEVQQDETPTPTEATASAAAAHEAQRSPPSPFVSTEESRVGPLQHPLLPSSSSSNSATTPPSSSPPHAAAAATPPPLPPSTPPQKPSSPPVSDAVPKQRRRGRPTTQAQEASEDSSTEQQQQQQPRATTPEQPAKRARKSRKQEATPPAVPLSPPPRVTPDMLTPSVALSADAAQQQKRSQPRSSAEMPSPALRPPLPPSPGTAAAQKKTSSSHTPDQHHSRSSQHRQATKSPVALETSPTLAYSNRSSGGAALHLPLAPSAPSASANRSTSSSARLAPMPSPLQQPRGSSGTNGSTGGGGGSMQLSELGGLPFFPQDSPALGFTQVHNTLAEEFSLDPSGSDSSSAASEYLYDVEG